MLTSGDSEYPDPGSEDEESEFLSQKQSDAGIHQYIICLLMFCLYRFFFLVRSLDIVLRSMIK